MSDIFKINEKFVSIDGEGPTAGALSVFIRFAGCNLRCVWCDTVYAQNAGDYSEELTAAQIAAYIRGTGISHVTLTGGEPLLQPGLIGLLSRLSDYQIHIETNGSLPFDKFRLGSNIHFVADYKLPASGEEGRMYLPNLPLLTKDDAIKFVVADKNDLLRAKEIIDRYNLIRSTMVYLSCVFDGISHSEVVEFMKEHKLNGVKLQLQLHKYIWDRNTKGV